MNPDTINFFLSFLHPLLNENLNFRKRLVKNKVIIFFPSKFTDPSEISPWNHKWSVDSRLRKAGVGGYG